MINYETDISVIDCGSIVIVTADSEAAREWIIENVYNGPETFQPTFPNVVYIEKRYAGDLLEGMADAGLVLEV